MNFDNDTDVPGMPWGNDHFVKGGQMWEHRKSGKAVRVLTASRWRVSFCRTGSHKIETMSTDDFKARYENRLYKRGPFHARD